MSEKQSQLDLGPESIGPNTSGAIADACAWPHALPRSVK